MSAFEHFRLIVPCVPDKGRVKPPLVFNVNSRRPPNIAASAASSTCVANNTSIFQSARAAPRRDECRRGSASELIHVRPPRFMVRKMMRLRWNIKGAFPPRSFRVHLVHLQPAASTGAASWVSNYRSLREMRRRKKHANENEPTVALAKWYDCKVLLSWSSWRCAHNVVRSMSNVHTVIVIGQGLSLCLAVMAVMFGGSLNLQFGQAGVRHYRRCSAPPPDSFAFYSSFNYTHAEQNVNTHTRA